MKDKRVVEPVSPSRTAAINTRHVYRSHAVVVMVTQVMVGGYRRTESHVIHSSNLFFLSVTTKT